MNEAQIKSMAHSLAARAVYQLAEDMDSKIKKNGELLSRDNLNKPSSEFIEKRIEEQKLEAEAYRAIARALSSPPQDSTK